MLQGDDMGKWKTLKIVLDYLMRGEVSPGDIVELSISTSSRILLDLKYAGVITVREDGRKRQYSMSRLNMEFLRQYLRNNIEPELLIILNMSKLELKVID